jgi:large repetitive protein
MNKKIILLLLLIAYSANILAQFSAVPTPAINATQLAQQLAGKGIIISNATLVCPNGAAANFSALSTTLGIDSGVVLTTGNVLTYTSGTNTNYGINGAASLSAKTDNLTVGGDADLATSANQAVTFLHDMCKLEFDFIPLSDTVKLNYKFASEEYPEYNCTQFNDVFGIYISGPGFATTTNIALVPGTTIPVSVNSVNDGTTSFFGNITNCTSLGAGSPFTALYTNNASSSNIVYDGMTNLFEARALVTPCSTYHFKVAIADLGDGDRDSGLFLKAGSFVSDAATIDSFVNASNLVQATPYIMEGCSSGKVYISRPFAKSTPLVVGISGVGSATLNTDYTVPSTVTIPANATTASFTVSAVNDAITEGTEQIKLYIYGSACSNIPTDSVIINVLEFPKYNVSNNDTICAGQSTSLVATTLTPNSLINYTWNPGNVANATANVSPTVNTNYTLSAAHPGCTIRDSIVAITVSPLPIVNAGIDKTICNASSTLLNGTVSGYLPYGINHVWSPSASLSSAVILNPVASPIVTTNYTLTATNSAGCSSTDVLTLTIAAPLNVSASVANALCNGASTGTATITAIGNVGATTYNVTPGSLSNSSGIFNNLSAGTYTAIVTDAATCSKTASFTIGQGAAINFNNPNLTTPACNGNTNGIIAITASGGLGAISYNLTPGNINNSTGTFNNLVSNIYTIKAIDAQGCTKTSTINLTQPAALSWSSVTKTNATCNGFANGVINAGLSGGNGNYTYTLNPSGVSNGTGVFANLGAATYTIAATDILGCSTSTTVLITQPNGMVFNTPSITAPSCNPGNNGSFTVTASGGANPVTYALAPTGSSNSSGAFSSLGIGAFIVTATDASGCTKSTVINLSYANAPAFTSVNKVNINCFGQNNGSITASASGGVGAVTYTLNPGTQINTTGVYANLGSGVYTIIARDANLCTTVSTVSITSPTVLNASISTSNGPLCNGSANGVINVVASGGTTTYTYTLIPGPINNSTGNFNSLNIGSYTINVVDAKGCTKSTNITLTQPSAIAWTGNNASTNILCNGANTGSISGIASGGTGSITYNLLPANINNNTGSFTGLAAGNYTIFAKDANNCSISKTVVITQPIAITLNVTNTKGATCTPGADGGFTVTASGGSGALTFQNVNTSQTNSTGAFANLAIGSYVVKVTDANGCTRTTNVIVANTNPPTLTVQFLNQTTCGIDSTDSLKVTAIGNGPFTYNLLPGGITNATGFFNNLQPGTYLVTVLDANNCTAATSIPILLPLPLTAGASVTQPACANNTIGSATVTASGGYAPYSYKNIATNLSNSTGIFSNLTSGTYSIEASDSSGCKDTVIFNITIPLPVNWTSVTKVNLPCNNLPGGSITPIASGGTGGILFTLNPGNITQSGAFNNLLANTYTLVAKDANNCSISTTVTLTQSPPITLSTPSISSPTCQLPTSGSISFTASGGAGGFSYSNGAATNTTGSFSSLTANSYTLTATDANGCTKTTLAVLVIPNAPSISNVIITKPSCPGNTNGSIATTTSGGSAPYTYSLNGSTFNGSSLFSNLGAGTYTVTSKDLNNCTVSSLVIVANPPTLTFNTPTITNVVCFNTSNGAITQTASGGTGLLTYTLSPGTSNTTGTFSNLGANTYTIQVADANACATTKTILLSAPNQIVFAAGTFTNPSCSPNNNGAINNTASGGAGGINYTLLGVSSNSTGVFNNLIAGTYTLSAQDANNCSATKTIVLATPNAPNFGTVNITNALCFNGNTGSIVAPASGGNGALTYSITPNASTNSNGTFNNLNANTYTVQVTDAVSCTKTTTVIVGQAQQILLNNVVGNAPLCNTGATANIIANASGSTGALSYKILPTNTINSSGNFTNLNPAVYTLSVSDVNNCSISSIVTIVAPLAVSWNSFNKVNVACNGDSSGIISCLAVGGTGAMSYTLLANNITTTLGGFNNLLSNSYTVIAKDANNCSISSTLSITEPSTKVAINSTTNTIPTCIPGNDATLTINANGGTGVLNYALNNGFSSNTNTISNIGIGSYTLTVTDAQGCTSTKSVSINNPNAPAAANITTSNATCFGGSNGSINLGANGGTGPKTFLLQPTLISSNTGSFNNLNAQTYTVVITDSIGCSSNASIIVGQASQINFTTSTIGSAACFGSPSNITISGSGGTGTLSYNLQPINFTNTTGIFNNINANTYTAIATDALGCSNTTLVLVTTPPALYWFAINKTNVSCNGGVNGFLAVNARGGTGTITYSVNPGNFVDTIGVYQNLPSAIYTIVVTDANGCTLSSTINVSQPPPIVYSTLNNTIPTCLPGNDAQLTVGAGGGVGPYLYSLNGSTFTGTTLYTNLGAGVYTVSVKDNNNCTHTQTKLISNPGAPNINGINLITPTCFGLSNGNLTTNVSGGTGALTYTLQPIAVTNSTGSFNNLAANTFTLTIKDAANCTVSSVINITEPVLLQYSATSTQNPLCFAAANGIIQHLAIGGTSTITYNLLPGNTNTTNDSSLNLVANTYTVKATDTKGCSISTVLTLNNPPNLLFNNPSVVHADCNGANNGILNYSAVGGSGALVYNLNPGAIQNSTGIYTSLNAPTTFTIQVQDANNCSKSSVVSITQPPALILNLVSIQGASCSPGGDGVTIVSVTGGTGLINYALDNGTTVFPGINGTFNNLANGNYTINITDANGCTATDVAQLVAPNSPNIYSVQVAPASCNPNNNGTSQVLANNGTPGYNYSINGSTFGSSNNFNALTANTYTASVQDSKGCIGTKTFQILTTPGVIVNSSNINSITCNGANNGSVVVNAGTGTLPYNFTSQPNNVTNTTGQFSNLSANIYSINITDANGCTSQALINISEPAVHVINNITATPPSCFNGNNASLLITTSGGTGTKTYVLSPGNITNTTGSFNGLLGNATYGVLVSDANNCSTSSTVFISQPTAININNVATTDVTCNGANDATLSVSANGGIGTLSYSVGTATNTTGSFNNLGGGIFTITITDANNCTATSSVNIFEPSAIQVVNNNTVAVSCAGAQNGSINVSAIGGVGALTYKLLPGNINNFTGTFTGLAGGSYTVSIRDTNNCITNVFFGITEPQALIINNVSTQDVLCFGANTGSITVNSTGGNGGNIFTINPNIGSNANNGTFTNLTANTYSIVISDSKSCSTSTLVTINQSSGINLVIDSLGDITCNSTNNGFIFTEASGGAFPYLYTLLPPVNVNATGDFVNLSAGNYTVTVLDDNGCTTSLSNIIINQPTPISFTSFVQTNVVCYSNISGSINAAANGGGGSTYTYTLLPMNEVNTTGIFDSLLSGTYTLQVVDNLGCTKDTILFIQQNAEIQLTNLDLKSPTCYGGSDGSIKFLPVGGVAPLLFAINNGAYTKDTFYQNLSAGTYFFSMIDTLGCTNDTTLILTQPDSLTIRIDSTKDVYCFPQKTGAIYSTASGGNGNSYNYILSPVNKITSTGIFQNIGIGTYTVIARDELGCSATQSVTLIESTEVMVPTISTTSLDCIYFGDNATATIQIVGGYQPYTYLWSNGDITATADSLGYGEHTVVVIDNEGCKINDTTFVDASSCCEVYVPNAFSPNGDNVNETWTPRAKGTLSEYNLAIYDRWGNKVFSTNTANESWDGTYKGVEMNMDTYFYLLKYQCTFDNQKRIEKGDITLLK